MNIMLFSRILAKTGVGNHIDLLSDALQKQGHHVIVCSGTQDIELKNTQVRFIKVDTLSRNPVKVLKSIIHIRKIIQQNSIDVVHCHHRVAAIYMRLYRLFFKTPFVYTLHLANIPHDFFHRMLTFTGDRAIGVSQEVSDFMVEKFKVPAKNVVTVTNGVDETKLSLLSKEEAAAQRKAWNIPEENYVVVLHSRIDEVKNQLLVVEAVRQLDEHEKAKLTVVCSGEKKGDYYQKVVNAVEQYGLEDVFRFVGWVDTRSVVGIADFLLAPSINEGFMFSAVEAFMMNVPVARTRTAGFDDQKYCIPIDAYDTKDIVSLLKKLCVEGKEQYAERIGKAYTFAMQEFTADAMARKTAAVYQEVCGNE